MKTKLVFAIAIIALIVSCSNHEEVIDITSLQESDFRNIRSFNEALQIAQNSIALVDGESKTRGLSPRKIDLSKSKVYKMNAKTRTSSDRNDTLLYVFNFENNQGFAVVSAANDTDGLLAVTEQGYYDPEEETDIEGFNMYMEIAKEYVVKKLERLSPEPYAIDSIVILAQSSAGPYVTVKWGQKFPEGKHCPNGIAGCTNTAIMQIMSYYGYPNSISLTYPGADINTQTLNWQLMKAHQTGHRVCSDMTTHNSIGRLARQLGELMGSSYYGTYLSDSAYTSTTDYNAYTVLQLLGYTVGSWHIYNYPTYTSWSDSDFVDQLDAQHLLLMGGQTNDGEGHSWVCDGYNYEKSIRYHFERAYPEGYILTGIFTTETYLYHYNWGWYGDCNGYFNSNVLNTTSGITNEGTTNHNYTFDHVFHYLPVYH